MAPARLKHSAIFIVDSIPSGDEADSLLLVTANITHETTPYIMINYAVFTVYRCMVGY